MSSFPAEKVVGTHRRASSFEQTGSVRNGKFYIRQSDAAGKPGTERGAEPMHAPLKPALRSAVSVKPSALEHPLAWLPCAAIGEYRKGQAIYTCGQPSTG